MDSQTVAALAAWAAAVVTLIGATFQFFIGRRQSVASLRSADAALLNAKNAGKHKIAEFRQEWIDKVIDALSEHHSILMSSCDSPLSPADHRKLSALRTKLEIYLNPDESDTVALVELIDEITKGPSAAERASKDDQMIQVARRLLKKEWVRIKSELS